MIFKNKLIRFLIVFLLISLLFTGSAALSSLIIVKTDISESLGGLFMTVITALCSLLFSLLLTVLLGIKGIYCTIMSFCTVMFTKVIVTVCVAGALAMTWQGIIGIIFTVIFCLLGSIMGMYIKK